MIIFVAELLLGNQFDCAQPDFGDQLVIEVEYDDIERFKEDREATIAIRYQGKRVPFMPLMEERCSYVQFREFLSRFSMPEAERVAICGTTDRIAAQ